MLQRLGHIWRLGIKELFSLRTDVVLLALIVYAFSFAVVMVSKGATTEVKNAAVAVVDEDQSTLSRRMIDAIRPPQFKPPVKIRLDELDAAMDAGTYTFVFVIPPNFERDVRRGDVPTAQLNVDATAMTYAGNGSAYLQSILTRELLAFQARQPASASLPINLVTHARFNPNLEPVWFMSVMQVINSITILAIILSGAAIIREREHGTLEHLLVMPLTPLEIMLAKVWAMGAVVVAATGLSLELVVKGVLDVPLAGSLPLFLGGAVLYLFAATSLGILLATLARSMPQFAMLIIPVFIIMYMLSGTITPLESMPGWLQTIMQGSPSTHFVRFAQAVLYRGADLPIVWPDMLRVGGIGALFFALALSRFRRMLQAANG